MSKKILVACEESQAVTKAFRDLGFEAYSCDTQSCSGGYPDFHIKGDVRDVLDGGIFVSESGKLIQIDKWDLIIAHPPCTYISNSGVRWLYEKDGRQNTQRWMNLLEAMRFFNVFVDFAKRTGIPVAIENPIPHKHAVNDIADKKGIGKYTQTIQPYEFGHTTSKRTCLWLFNGLPMLKATKIIPKEQRTQEIWKCAPGPERQKIRSKTFEGIAQAMASQWGEYLN